MPSGTLGTIDLLKSNFQSVESYGEDNLYDNLRGYYEYHNQQMQWFMEELYDRTTEKEMIFGTSDDMGMDEYDEYGRPHAQKIAYGVRVGFPLRMWGRTLQWTRNYFREVPVAEFTAQYLGVLKADRQRVVNEAMRAIFTPTNYDWQDVNVAMRSVIPIPVKALVNADSARIPAAPNGTTFDGSTHTHYLATASLAASDVSALIDTVAEHYTAGALELAINRAQLATLKTFTANFLPYAFSGVTQSVNANRALGGRQTTLNNQDQEVGIWDDVPVWVRKWVPANYMVAYVRGAANKVLMMRTRTNGSGELEILAEDERFPLRARSYGREFGFGVRERTGAAVLRTNNGSYAAPTIA